MHRTGVSDVEGKGISTLLCVHGFPTSGYDWVKVSSVCVTCRNYHKETPIPLQ